MRLIDTWCCTSCCRGWPLPADPERGRPWCPHCHSWLVLRGTHAAIPLQPIGKR